MVKPFYSINKKDEDNGETVKLKCFAALHHFLARQEEGQAVAILENLPDFILETIGVL